MKRDYLLDCPGIWVIQERFCAQFNIPLDAMRAGGRMPGRLGLIRGVAIRTAREEGYTLAEIARAFNLRHKSTVNYIVGAAVYHAGKEQVA